jgi:Spy/CpxP family protein refolding chaperone
MSQNREDRVTRFRGRPLLLGVALVAGLLIVASSLAGHGRPRWHQNELSQAELLQNMTKRTAWALRRVDATDEQRARIDTILATLAPELVTLRKERHALMGEFLTIVEADEVGPEELARLHAAGLSLAERAFRRTTDIVLQVSEVLTPEQRQALVQEWKEWR